MMRSLWTAASGMRAQQTNVDTIANNLANVNSTGYKTQQASFKSLLYQNLQSTSTNNAGEDKPVSAEVGLGTRTAAITSRFTQGNLQPSESPFSMAIEGDGFFQVKNINDETLYTRDGSFILSPNGTGNMLCTSDGYPVLDTMGNAIVLPADRVATAVNIGQDGALSFPDEKGNHSPYMSADGTYAVKIGIVQFNNPAGLEKAGGNAYKATVASGAAIVEDGAIGVKQSRIDQYYLEGSNVDVANEMVDLIVAQRAYELNSKAIQTSDTMMQQANNLRS